MQSIGEHVFSTKKKLWFKVGKLEKGNSRKRQNTGMQKKTSAQCITDTPI